MPMVMEMIIATLIIQKIATSIDNSLPAGTEQLRINCSACVLQHFPNALFSIRTRDRNHVEKFAVELRRLKYVKSVEEL